MCGIQRRALLQSETMESWVVKAKEVHGNSYEYLGPYLGNKIKTTIVCKIHGSFNMRPNNHLNGQGCPTCGKSLRGWNFSKWDNSGKESKYFESFKVYIIKCFNHNEEFIKVGKTFNSLSSRFYSKFEMPYQYEVVKIFIFEDGISCSEHEYNLHKRLNKYKYFPLISFQGESECFSLECLNYYE